MTSTSNAHNFKRLTSDDDHYIGCYKVIVKDAAKYEVFGSWYDKIFHKEVIGKLQVEIPDDGEFKALGIGTGPGEIDTKMMHGLSKRFPRIKSFAVEPANGHVLLHQKHVKEMGNELQNVSYEWRVQDFAEFRKTREEGGDQTKFHFISTVQSVYYIGDVDEMQQSLRWLYDQLEDGGVMLMIVHAENNGWYSLVNRFSFLEYSDQHNFHSGHVREAFTKFGIQSSTFHQKNSLDITNSFQEGSQDGQRKVDFLTFVANFHNTASPDLRQEVMAYLSGSHCSEQKDGKCFLNIDWDAVIITK